MFKITLSKVKYSIDRKIITMTSNDFPVLSRIMAYADWVHDRQPHFDNLFYGAIFLSFSLMMQRSATRQSVNALRMTFIMTNAGIVGYNLQGVAFPESVDRSQAPLSNFLIKKLFK